MILHWILWVGLAFVAVWLTSWLFLQAISLPFHLWHWFRGEGWR